mgnify:CR=1 FL=1
MEASTGIEREGRPGSSVLTDFWVSRMGWITWMWVGEKIYIKQREGHV